MGAVTPLGNTAEETWQNMLKGVSGAGPITHFDASKFKTRFACEVKGFDVTQFVDRKEARKLDPYCQYAVAAAQMAVEDCGLDLETVDKNRVGVVMGVGIGGMKTYEEEVTNYALTNETAGPRFNPFFVPKMIADICVGHISIKYGFRGPNFITSSACASSTNALAEAFNLIRLGKADMIVSGGAEAAIGPTGVAGFINCMALSSSTDPEVASIPFDKRRNGFVMGEGAGILILEEYEHAKARGAKIYAEMGGYGSTCDAYHMTAPDPEAGGAARAIKDAVREAGMEGETKVYFNAHGTSTPLNDKSETLAIKKAFGDDAYKILISSTKSMTGHMLGATGGVEAIAAILAMREGVVPPTIGLKEPDPDCDLDYVPLVARKADINLALSVNLGFGGHNACLAFKKCED